MVITSLKDLFDFSYVGCSLLNSMHVSLLGYGEMFTSFNEVHSSFVRLEKNSNFLKNGKIVILVKIRNFSRSRMTKRISPLESSSKI